MDQLFAEAMDRFREILVRARNNTSLREPTAVTLATASREGLPSARVVLLREVDDRGFVFYTNTASAKAVQLADNPRAALCFHWDELREQVRIIGQVERVSDEQADLYWATRPRDSQIGAWASRQSAQLDSRDTLEQRTREYATRFADRDVPRPPFWTGYRVVPDLIEFWRNRPSRLHERVVYQVAGDQWERSLLYP